MSGSGNGSGFTVSFPADALWDTSNHFGMNCPGETILQTSCPAPTSPNPGPIYQFQQNIPCYPTWDTTTCQWVYKNCKTNTPVLVDTANTGFLLTDPGKGDYVSFDMAGDGHLAKLSWPAHGSGNAWLVYDRDGDGIIKDGTELFGNYSPHSDGGVQDNKDANGFLALAWYDQQAQGGNGDLIIDKNDAIWKHLKLWIDEHCYLTKDEPCQSTPSELYDLDAKGIHSLSLVYGVSPGKADKVGNGFKFYAVVNPEVHDAPLDKFGNHVDGKGQACCDLHQKSKDGRLMYDVFLRQVP